MAKRLPKPITDFIKSYYDDNFPHRQSLNKTEAIVLMKNCIREFLDSDLYESMVQIIYEQGFDDAAWNYD